MQKKVLFLLIFNLLIVLAGSAETYYSSKAGTWCWARYGKSYCFRKLPADNANDTFVVDREIKLEGNFIIEGNLIIEDYGKLIITGEGSLEIKGSLEVSATGTLHVNNNLTFHEGSLVSVGEFGKIFVAGDFKNLNLSEEAIINGSLEVMGLFENEGTISGLGKVVAAGGCTETVEATVFGYSDCEGTNVFTLPVSLLSFQGIAHKEHIAFSWTTANESDLDFFTIERSTDLEVFEEIGKVSASVNDQDDHVKNTYFFKEYFPSRGFSYYRLKATDINGKAKVNSPIVINFQGEELKKMNIFPNPLTGGQLEISFNLDSNLPKSISIRNITGQDVFYTSLAGPENNLQLPKPLKPGMYILSLTEGGNSYQSRLVVK